MTSQRLTFATVYDDPSEADDLREAYPHLPEDDIIALHLMLIAAAALFRTSREKLIGYVRRNTLNEEHMTFEVITEWMIWCFQSSTYRM